MMPVWSAVLVLAAVAAVNAQDVQKVQPGSLAIEDVISLSKAGVSDDVIVAKIKGNAKAFNLNADEIVELKKAGLSDAVVRYMLDPSLPYTPPPPPPSPSPPAAGVSVAPPSFPPKPPSDPLVLKVPPQVGIYYLTDGGEFRPLDLKPVVPYKQPGKMSALSGGLLKGHIIGSVVGAIAATRIPGASAIFYVRLGDKVGVEDLALLILEKSGTRRDLDFGTKPGKPVFPVSSVRQFESKEASAGLIRLYVPLSRKGEYLFYILGSGDEKKGLLGKGYDFGLD